MMFDNWAFNCSICFWLDTSLSRNLSRYFSGRLENIFSDSRMRKNAFGLLWRNAPWMNSMRVIDAPSSQRYRSVICLGSSSSFGTQPYLSPIKPMKNGWPFSSKHRSSSSRQAKIVCSVVESFGTYWIQKTSELNLSFIKHTPQRRSQSMICIPLGSISSRRAGKTCYLQKWFSKFTQISSYFFNQYFSFIKKVRKCRRNKYSHDFVRCLLTSMILIGFRFFLC